MNPDTIDLIYQNESVEGVAIFNSAGELIENQLSYNEDSVTKIAQTMLGINQALTDADRFLKGFLIKSETTTLQICIFDDFLLIMALSDPHAADTLEKAVRSIFGKASSSNSAPAHVIPETSNQKTTTNTVQAEQVVQQEPQPVTPEPAGEEIVDGIKLDDYKPKLMTLLKRVAPGNVAEKIINEAMTANAIGADTPTLTIGQAITVGESAVSKIPNAGKRKLVNKEFQLLIYSISKH